eukprot:CAMPEP_0181331916 /NCGR_PEP_ID=MMETSP1101-20121128/24788_1 /TAXON_ID=46948 /ORGANISM="Rhodomonas abbreviata, Strain Caron Lab Isolate" /LENGTH=56 /DNA_ID=CAMNT_0023441471 /DNA_START=362 /DNA_END=530 /DNA_ORIENTATION=-
MDSEERGVGEVGAERGTSTNASRPQGSAVRLQALEELEVGGRQSAEQGSAVAVGDA